MEVGDPLWTAVLNSKVVMFYLMGSYLWHFPPSCATVADRGSDRGRDFAVHAVAGR
jgi:hypothetical protein